MLSHDFCFYTIIYNIRGGFFMPKLANDLSLTKNTRLNSLGPSKIRAFDEKASQIPGIIKLTIGEPDLNTPDHVKDAAIADIKATTLIVVLTLNTIQKLKFALQLELLVL